MVVAVDYVAGAVGEFGEEGMVSSNTVSLTFFFSRKRREERGRDTLIIHPHRPMHKIQIHIIQPQRFQARIKSLLDPVGVHIPQFRSHEEILSLHEAIVNGGLDTFADVDFVAVGERGVDVAVSDFDGVVDCALSFFGGRLPRSFSRLLVMRQIC